MIYLDNAASTPLYTDVIKAMQRSLLMDFANPSAKHKLSKSTLEKIDNVRRLILTKLNAPADYEVIFTSSATESNNQILFSYTSGETLHYSAADHLSVVNPILNNEKVTAKKIPLSPFGGIQYDALNEINALAISHVNSLTGSMVDLKKLLESLPSATLHIDATQSFGKFPIDLTQTPVTTLTICAHKMGGPKGIGAIVYKKDFHLKPLLLGGKHEQGLRASTLNTPAILAWGEAIVISHQSINREFERVLALKSQLTKYLKQLFNDDVTLLETDGLQSPYILFFALENVPSDVIMRFLEQEEIFIASSTACNSKLEEKSFLETLEIPPRLFKNTLRVSFSHKTNAFEIDQFCESLKKVYDQLKGLKH